VTRVVTLENVNTKRRLAMIKFTNGCPEDEIKAIMDRPEAFESYNAHGAGKTFYDYVKMIVTEYHKIAINTHA
jgi:hypothetical protein